MNLQYITNQTLKIAIEAGEYLRQARKTIPKQQIEEKSQGNFVTDIDRNSEEILREKLTGLIPSSVVMAEENSPDASGGEYRWIVDPLDGTLNYLQGLPIYAVSIALEDRRNVSTGWGEIVSGVIYLPDIDVEYHALKSGGAFKNGKPIHIRANTSLRRAVIATGFPFRNRDVLDKYFRVFRDIFLKTANTRRIGSAAADLAWTAEGVFDGFWETNLSPWDIAAGSVLIEEAGGIITDFWNDFVLNTCWVIAGNGLTYYAMREIIQKVFTKKV